MSQSDILPLKTEAQVVKALCSHQQKKKAKAKQSADGVTQTKINK